MANKETAVGGIVGFLRLENDQFVRAINEALGKTAQLDGKKVDVKVDADTAKANAQLAATEKQVDRLDKANARVSKSATSAGRGMRPLVTAVLTLGPALIPAAAGATALAAAFGGMATAGVLAVVGVAKEMQEGTEVGRTYRSALQGAKDDLTGLARVAAGNTLKPFLDMVADLNQRMPALRGQIGDLATITGSATAAFAGGLLNAFQSLEPLMRDASIYVLHLGQAFERAMSGQGVVAFGDYIRSVFPQVLEALGSITAAAAHLIASMEPLGLGALTGLQMLSDLLRTVPTEVLSVLASGAWAVFAGFKVWSGLHAGVSGLGKVLEKVGVQAGTAATAMRGLNIAAGVIGVALAGLSWIVAQNAEATRKNQQEVNDLTDALIASNGVLDEHVRKVQYNHLVQSGAMDAYKALGGNVRDLVDASLGLASGQEKVNAVLAAAKPTAEDFGAAGVVVKGKIVALTDATNLVKDAVGGANGQLKAGQQAQKDYADATANATVETSGAAGAVQNLADKYGTSAATFQKVADAQQGIADKAAAATVQMQLENDAAGLLKQSLDLLNGENMSAAQAQNSFERAQSSVGDQIERAKKAEADALARLNKGSGSGKGGPSRGSTDSLASAQLRLSQAQEHLNTVRSNPKATASAIESANQRVARAQLAVSQAQGRVSESAAKAAGSSGGLSAEQRKEAEQAVATARAQIAAAKALTGNSDEAIQNRANLLSVAQAAELTAEKFGAQKDSAEAGRQKLIELKKEIIDNAAAQGLNREEVKKYIDQIMKIPASVPPTKADIDKTEADRKLKALQASINAITGKTVTMTIQEVYQQSGQIAAQRVHNEQAQARRDPLYGIRANGGLTLASGVRAMASGDLLGREPMIMRSTKPILWNEAPGGEAYIPLAPAKRARALSIWEQTGAALGAGSGGRQGPLDLSRGSSKSLARDLARELRKNPPVVSLSDINAGLGGY